VMPVPGALPGAMPGVPQGYVSHYPGPPIQTSKTCQGPEGCNLFIFHIPNDLTNIDLYNLFVAFGNVISARIMVENETGRSRGFGFVSYDNQHAADAAIKSMNGYQIGRKRLKVQHKKKERSEPGGAPAFVGPPGAAYPPGPPAPGGNYVYLTTPGGIPQAIPANGGVAPSQAGAPPAPEIMSPQQQALQHQLAQLQQQQRQVQEQQRQVQEQQRQHQLQQQQQQLLAQAQAHAQAQQQVQQQQQKQQQAQLQAQQSSSQGGSKADGAGDPLYSRSSPDNSSPPDGGNLLANQVQGDMLADALSSLHFNGKDEPSTDAERANSPLGGGGLEVGIGFSSAIGGSDNLFSEFLGGAGGSGGGGGGGDDGSGGGGGGGNGANAGDSTSTPLETAAAALAAVTSSGSNTTIDSMGGYSSSAISTAGGQPFGPGVVSRAQSDTSGYSTEVGSGLFAHPNGVGTAIGTPAAAAAAAASDGAPAAGAMSTDAQIEALQRQLQQQSALLQGQSELLRNLLNTQTQTAQAQPSTQPPQPPSQDGVGFQ